MTPADLQKFCSTDPTRKNLSRPFTADGFTWATNGHIIVRVPLIDGVLPPDYPVPLKAALRQVDFATPMRPMIAGTLPEPRDDERCYSCGRNGMEHDCPCCTCPCQDCNGTGRVKVDCSVMVGEGIFSLKYIALIQTLPNPMVPTMVTAGMGPMPFTFEGGIGALMPMSRPYERHFLDIRI